MSQTTRDVSLRVADNPPPRAGFIDRKQMSSLLDDGFDQLAPAADQEVAYGREQFRKILESVAEEQRDLPGVVY